MISVMSMKKSLRSDGKYIGNMDPIAYDLTKSPSVMLYWFKVSRILIGLWEKIAEQN